MNGRTSSRASGEPHPERFDPDRLGGQLIDVEHRGRYWWASQLAAGKDVLDAACGTGYGSEILLAAGARSVSAVDVDAGAVEQTARRLSGSATVVQADLRELPFEAESLDLVVCWEAIEHIEQGERVVAEFKRVLRAGGLVLVSSPNPLVYPAGNEHHVHEYRPAELARLLEQAFSNVASYRQHPWLASVIERAGTEELAGGGTEPKDRLTRAVGSLERDGETFSLVAAGDAALPDMRDLIALGSAFEVKWWQDQLNEEKRQAAGAAAREREALKRLQETSKALLEANQSLAEIPVLHHRLEEMHDLVAGIENSPSWRVTAPLRWMKQRLRRR